MGLLLWARLEVQGTEATVVVGHERVHAELLGQGQGLLVVGFGLCGIGGSGVGMDNAKLVQRERLVPALFVLPGQVERLAGVLPGLLAASRQTTDLAEPCDQVGTTLQSAGADKDEQFYVMCLDMTISGPRLIRAWKRRHWIEHCFRTLKHLLATGACQVQSEEAYYGHLVLRLMGCFVLFYTSRVVSKGRLTMEEIIFSLKHYWRFVDSEALELKALSQEVAEKAA